MRTIRRPFTVSCLATWLAAGAGVATAQTVAVDNDDIGGTVNGPAGPEAGVWVIAETDAFETRYAKIVVTDDRGRYVVPDLPPASYQVWVRGYGLVDSTKVAGRPGQTLDLVANAAPSPAAAAVVYPAAYWYSMMKVPTASEVSSLPGGVNQYLASVKNLSCIGCHQIGQLATRTLPQEFASLPSHHDAWVRRIQSGQAGSQMLASAMNQLGGVPPKYLADWTERVAKGELPHAQPQRPRGVERNIVATVRDWSTDKAYMHDLSGTDRRNPTVNAYGKLYGAPELSTDEFPILDPKTNTATSHHAPVQDPSTPTTNSTPPTQPSAYWGNEAIWDSKANAHNPMLDEQGRVWYTAVVRAPDNAPAYCRADVEPSVGEAVPAAALGPAALRLRSEDGEVHVHRHVLLDASPAIRRGRERHAVDERRRSRRRLAELEDVPRDRRRRALARLDGARARHERQRQARRLRRARSTRRPGEGQAHQQRRSTP